MSSSAIHSHLSDAHQSPEVDSSDDEHSDTSSNVANDICYVEQMPIVDPYGKKGVYTGELSMSTCMPNGEGRLDYEQEGRWYEGEWLHGRWTGRGSFANGDGDFYKGSFKNDKKHGDGVMKFADGRIFEGEYIRGQMIHGKMKYQDRSIYNGAWKNGIRHGKGRIVFVDGSSYDGEFREGDFDGHGKMVWADGGWYLGEWRQGTMHGYGKEITPDGRVRHDGQWRQGQPSIGARTQRDEQINRTQTEDLAPVSTPLAKCFCNWKHCRTYQKAFREYNHPFFNGAIKLTFSPTDSGSMALKSSVDRILCIDSARRNDWKEGDNGEPFCRYYVARHHFTEALIHESLENRLGWDWNRPLGMEEAKKFLWSLERDDVYHSEDEAMDEEDDRYVQAPNVPKDKVREMLKELRYQHKQAQEQDTMGKAVAVAELTLPSNVTDAPEVFVESVDPSDPNTIG